MDNSGGNDMDNSGGNDMGNGGGLGMTIAVGDRLGGGAGAVRALLGGWEFGPPEFAFAGNELAGFDGGDGIVGQGDYRPAVATV